MRTKLSKHQFYDDPSAFYRRFPAIEEITDGSLNSPMADLRPVKYFKMGKCKVMVAEPHGIQGWFMSIQLNDRYPTWDELVWLRYRLIPDAARMANILPNLNSYINKEDTHHKFVFTMEQTGWELDPHPICINCQKPLTIDAERQTINSAPFFCADCRIETPVNFNTWNEQHGNGATVDDTKSDVTYKVLRMTKGRLRVSGEFLSKTGTLPFDEIVTVSQNDTSFNRLDILTLQQVSKAPEQYKSAYVRGNSSLHPEAPYLAHGEILLATLSVPSRWRSISDVLITYPSGDQA